MTFDIGDVVELTATFTDPKTGKPVDPDSVICTVEAPDGTTSTPEISGKEGTYTAETAPAEDGRYRAAVDGTGAHQASVEITFSVRKRQVPR